MCKVLIGFLLTFLMVLSVASAQTKTYDLQLGLGLLETDFYDGLDNLDLPEAERPGPAFGSRIAILPASSNDGQRVAFRAIDLGLVNVPNIEVWFTSVANFFPGIDLKVYDPNGNGVPDLQEIRCFSALVSKSELPALVMDAWLENQFIAEGELAAAGIVAPGFVSLAAYYMTISDGTDGNRRFVSGLCAFLQGCVFNGDLYNTSQYVDAQAAIDACLITPVTAVGNTNLYVVDVDDSGSWKRVTHNGAALLGGLAWTPDDQFLYTNGLRISVDTGLEAIAFNGATSITTTRLLPGTNWAAGRFKTPINPPGVGPDNFISVGTIADDGSADFERIPDGFAAVIVGLDLGDSQSIGGTSLSADGSLLTFEISTPSTQDDPNEPGFESDENDIYVLVGPKDIALAAPDPPDANGDGVIDNGVLSLSDPRIIPIRTTAEGGQRNKGVAKISEDNSLVIFNEDFGGDGLGSKFVGANPFRTVELSDFDAMLAKADGSAIDGANDSNDFDFVDTFSNTLVSDITPGGIRLLAHMAPTFSSQFEIFLSTLAITTDISGQLIPLPEGDPFPRGGTLTNSAFETTDTIVITDASGTTVTIAPMTIINFPQDTPPEISISTPSEPIDPSAFPKARFALPIVRVFEPAGTQFSPEVEICVTYTDAEVAGIRDETKLLPFLFDPATGTFNVINVADITVRDTENNIICFLVDHFSMYAIGAEANQKPTAVCQDVTLALDAAGMATLSPADIDGGSADPDGDPLTLSIEGNTEFTGADVGTPQIVTLVVEDGFSGISRCLATVTVVVDNTLPVITLVGGDITLECPDPYEELEATALDDVDGDISDSIVIDASAVDSTTLGTYVVTYNVSDSAGNAADEVTRTVVVQDTTPPSITSSFATPDVLFPPNHQLIDVTCNIVADDACDPAPPTITLVSITSNESDNGFGVGDGNTSNDIQVDTSTSPPTIKLRSERAGKGDGRVYTITFEVKDASGNATEAVCTVEVPKNGSTHTCDNPDCDLNSN